MDRLLWEPQVTSNSRGEGRVALYICLVWQRVWSQEWTREWYVEREFFRGRASRDRGPECHLGRKRYGWLEDGQHPVAGGRWRGLLEEGAQDHSFCALPVLPEADPEGQRSLELGPCSRFFHKRLFTVEWMVDLSSRPLRGESHSKSSDSCLHKKHAKPSAPKRGDSYESRLDCPPWPEAMG